MPHLFTIARAGAKLSASMVRSTTWLAFVAMLLAASSASAQPRAVAALGKAKVQGQDVLVEVFVVVHPGQNARRVARAALDAQGAQPVQEEAFTVNGLIWDQLPVIQNYNPSKQAVSMGQAALEATQSTWSSVATSAAEIVSGGTTNRCPSLVKECPGPQTFDGNNDVGWRKIGGCCTLGVTWFGTATDEADMALNTNFSWADDGVSDFDVETVFLHENGHVLGLGHSPVVGAVMEATYAGVRDTLHQDDEDGVTFLYPLGVTTTTAFPITTSSTTTTTTTTTTLGVCLVKNEPCSFDSDCCSNKCKGRAGAETCK